MMRTIALEEHYATEAFMEGPGRDIKAQAEAARDHPRVAAGFAKLVEGLRDIGEGRIAEMDAAGIDVQVLSLTSPGVEQLEASEAVALARETNDHLAQAVRRHRDRFAGFAALPTAAPEAAAEELERAVREYGFVGALINGHTGDVTWTTSSSGRSWSVRRRSGSRSTSTRRRLRGRWSRPPTRGTTRRG